MIQKHKRERVPREFFALHTRKYADGGGDYAHIQFFCVLSFIAIKAKAKGYNY